ncbi:MAG: hypothetical protein JXA24_01735 [Proteobacteria bacterium]|nr:hypothetical protein [Pseudomonadota bacterium]
MVRKLKKKAKVKAEAKVKARPKPKPKPKPKPQPKKISSNFNAMPVRQIAAAVSRHLSQAGYDPVLTGRACAAAYIGARIKPKTLDFVLTEYEVPELAEAMRTIGFMRSGLYNYVSRRSPVDVVFSPPPLAVGDHLVKETAVMKAKGGSIRLLTPTDCCRQRLSMYYRWGDREAFDDAVELALCHEIDMDLVKRWSDWEWCSDRFEEFHREIKKRS